MVDHQLQLAEPPCGDRLEELERQNGTATGSRDRRQTVAGWLDHDHDVRLVEGGTFDSGGLDGVASGLLQKVRSPTRDFPNLEQWGALSGLGGPLDPDD